MLLLFAIALVSALYLAFKYTKKPPGFPPGPPRRPLLLGGRPPNLFHWTGEAVKQYGKVFGFYMGATPCVVIADFEVLKDLFKREELASRPPTIPTNELRIGHELPELRGRAAGIIFTDGRYWRDQRRFALRHLRDFGFGKASMEGVISVEVEKLCRLYQTMTDQKMNLHRTVNASVINSLWTILVGGSFELGDPKLESICATMEETLMKHSTTVIPLAHILPHPKMVKLPLLRKISGYESIKGMFEALYGLVRPYIKEHRETFDRENPRDLMDLIIKETEDTTDPDSPFYGHKGEIALYNLFVELFIAGMDTTSFSLVWTFLYMLHHPDVQEKVHQELDTVCGNDRLPSLSDHDNLHYTNAVLHESLRITSLVYNSIPHHTTVEVQTKDFVIPKDSIVYGAIHHVMNDPEYWTNPDKFDPSRFLDKSSGKFVPNERVLAFGTGKRVCLGQSLAEKEFFLFFTGIMQSFEIRRAPGVELPGYDIYVNSPRGLLRQPPKYQAVLHARNDDYKGPINMKQN